MAVSGEAVVITVHAQPGARTSAIAGEYGDALKVRVAAPPVDGKANDALADFLAAAVGIAPRQVRLLVGETSRRKRFRLEGANSARVIAALCGVPAQDRE